MHFFVNLRGKLECLALALIGSGLVAADFPRVTTDCLKSYGAMRWTAPCSETMIGLDAIYQDPIHTRHTITALSRATTARSSN
ncbi:hypothetical protein BC826DRAFT_1044927 [Russula brevipes]|nr:hypothetical protein BC826DRAFT_1044927 [Russula brevipes]